jgi:hypothetical protein
MFKIALFVTGFCVALAASPTPPRADEYLEYGTSDEAKAMLDRAVLALKVDKGKAIQSFNFNTVKFRDRDLFVFCFNGDDGAFIAHEALVGQDVRTLHDKTGKPFGEQMYLTAKEDQTGTVAYVAPLPGSTLQVPKRAYITRVNDQVCGVSFYRFNGPGTPIEYTR